ncbi:hypothetical protein MKX54_17475 [Alkalihalobacillus sp. FSL R5-0424]
MRVQLAQSHIQELIDYLHKLGFSDNQIKDQLHSLLEAQEDGSDAEN